MRISVSLSAAAAVYCCCCFAFESCVGVTCAFEEKFHSFAIFIHANERISTAIKLYTVYLLLGFLWCRLVHMFFVTLFLSIDCLKMQIDIQNTFRFITFHFISTNGFRNFFLFAFWFKTHIHSHIHRYIEYTHQYGHTFTD